MPHKQTRSNGTVCLHLSTSCYHTWPRLGHMQQTHNSHRGSEAYLIQFLCEEDVAIGKHGDRQHPYSHSMVIRPDHPPVSGQGCFGPVDPAH